MSKNKEEARKRRHRRVRKKVAGTQDRPRLNVFRSIDHIYAQLIDDFSGKTLAHASSVDKELKGGDITGGNTKSAEAVGELIAKRAADKGIKDVIFDRGGYMYHGRVKALAEAARKGGLKF